MPQHRGFTLHKFVTSAGPELLGEYFAEEYPKIALPADPLTAATVSKILEDLSADIRLEILEQWQSINDLAERSMDWLHVARLESGLDLDREAPLERVAMALFLRSPTRFLQTHAKYRASRLMESVQIRRLEDVAPDWNLEKLPEFEEAIRQWFASMGKGEHIVIWHYEEQDSVTFLIGRGDHPLSQQVWVGGRPQHHFARPLREDVLRVQRDPAAIFVKVHQGHTATITAHLTALGTHILDIADFDPKKYAADSVSLKPIQNGTFSFAGNSAIDRIDLVEAHLFVPGTPQGSMILKSDDVAAFLTDNLRKPGLLKYAKLDSVDLMFYLNDPKRGRREQRLALRPPFRTNIPSRADKRIIEDYLRGQSVLLV